MRSPVVFAICVTIVISNECYGDLPEGFQLNNATGHAYKLIYHAEPWINARTLCKAERAKLTVPKSENEFAFLQDMVQKMRYKNIVNDSGFKLLVWVGVSNLENYTIWKNVDGENISDTGYHSWADRNGITFSANPAEPHCVAIDGHNRGLRDWWCHLRLPYICEIKQ